MTPVELVQLAKRRGLNAIAITDHDTTAGIHPAQEAANGSPVVIPGVEMSCGGDAEEIHLLGYYLNPDDPALNAALHIQHRRRQERAQAMLERLSALGAPITWEAVLAQAAGESISRPHVARALVEAGHVDTVNGAFDRYLRVGQPAYVAGKWLALAQAIDLIHQAGGAAVLAHPGLLREPERWANQPGLDGLEVMHPAHRSSVRANLRGLARRLDLIVTGGSDFHRLGDALASQTVPPDTLQRLRQRADSYPSPDKPG